MNLKLKPKLIASFLIVCIIFGIGSIVSYVNMKQINDTYTYLNEVVNELNMIGLSIDANVNQQSVHLRGYLLTEDAYERQQLDVVNEQINAAIQAGRDLSTLPETIEQFNRIEQLNNDYKGFADHAISLANININEAISYTNNNVIPQANEIREAVQSFNGWLSELSEERTSQASNQVNRAMFLVVTNSLVALAIAIVFGIVIANVISNPIIRLTKTAKQLAAGNLAVEHTKIKNRDEVYELNESFNEMATSLRETVSQISTNAEHVASSSEELTSSAEETSRATNQITEAIQSVASGAEKQVESTNHVREIVNDISYGMQQIVSSVEVVSSSTTVAEERSKNGVEVVNKAIDQMNTIQTKTSDISEVVTNLGEKSKEIGGIISLITAVAEQTNLLALNAAIEAARAGEHGKGFAVVADEVRKLAEQSNRSANQISSLIQDIQQDIEKSVIVMGEGRSSVQEGLTYVNEAGTEFHTISSSIDDISKQIQEVSASVEQIKAGAETMVGSIEDAASIAEQSSVYSQNVAASAEEQMATMEEIATAAEGLSTMAEKLQAEVGKFKLGV